MRLFLPSFRLVRYASQCCCVWIWSLLELERKLKATMIGMSNLYGFIDLLGSSIGIMTNALLIIAIFKTSGRGKIQAFSYMVFVSAVFDSFFCWVEVLTQHAIVVRKGVLFVFPHGIESVLGEWSYYVFIVPHVFSCTQAVLIRGPQYKFRCDLISGKATDPMRQLAKYVAISSFASLLVGFSASYGIYQTKRRGDQYYLTQLDGTSNENMKRNFLYACDIRDIGTFCFYGGGFVLTTICFWLCVYYVWKAYKFVAGRAEDPSERTKSLQRQFTLSLIAQSVNAVIFAIAPVSMVCISMLLRLDSDFIGAGTMVPLSWLSVANATLTLYIVKAYREFVRSLFCGKSDAKVQPSSSDKPEQSTDKRQATGRTTVRSEVPSQNKTSIKQDENPKV
ncbi:hypothetical protein M3Y96_01018700 [Aphelenchoides besseyi]|nr:hypothetical protein M3Y96_01018700 [Aphelenchoides besseyi]